MPFIGVRFLMAFSLLDTYLSEKDDVTGYSPERFVAMLKSAVEWYMETNQISKDKFNELSC